MATVSSEVLISASPSIAAQGRDAVSALRRTTFNAVLAVTVPSVPQDSRAGSAIVTTCRDTRRQGLLASGFIPAIPPPPQRQCSQ